MTADDAPRFAELMAGLAETYAEPISKVRGSMYFDALSDLTIDQVELGVRLALRRSKFFPRPAEIREHVEGNTDDRAAEAWASLMNAIRRVGYVRLPELEPATMETVRRLFGTWRRCCELMPAGGPELQGWQKRFTTMYAGAENRAQAAALLSGPTLAGFLAEGAGPKSMDSGRRAGTLVPMRKAAR